MVSEVIYVICALCYKEFPAKEPEDKKCKKLFKASEQHK